MEKFSIVEEQSLVGIGNSEAFLYEVHPKDGHIASISNITEEKASKLKYTLHKGDKVSFENFSKFITGKVYLTYPLSTIVEVEITNASSIGSLLWKVAQVYKALYKEEEEGANVKTTPEEQRGMVINRNRTDGKYGIWGHDLSDLYFEIVQFYKNGLIELFIGS